MKFAAAEKDKHQSAGRSLSRTDNREPVNS